MKFEQFLSYSLLFEKTHDDIPSKNQNGTCYQDSMQYMMTNSSRGDTKYQLCHGLVTGQGSIEGVIYNHAWVELGNKVIDETIPVTMPKVVYYAIGNIDKKTVFRYTYNQMSEKVSKFGTYGPWERVLIKNKY